MFLGMFPMVGLIPVWGILYVITGKFLLGYYIDYMDNIFLNN